MNFSQKTVLMATTLLVVSSSAVYASGGIAMAEEWTWRLDGSRILNAFLIFAGVFYLIKRFAVPIMKNRAKEIAERRENLEKAGTEAEARLNEMETKLAAVEEESARMRKEAREDGETIKASIVSQAKEQADQIVAKAKEQIELDTEQARQRLREETILAAVDMAEEIIKKNIGPDDHKRLVDGCLNRLASNN